MKYIRTKDGQIVNRFEFNCFKSHGTTGRYIVRRLEDDNDLELWLKYNRTSIVKQANTIEELCDEFVVVRENGKSMTALLDLAKEYAKCGIKTYGAIWTDKGLIYVAKMEGVLPNGEIDWELL